VPNKEITRIERKKMKEYEARQRARAVQQQRLLHTPGGSGGSEGPETTSEAAVTVTEPLAGARTSPDAGGPTKSLRSPEKKTPQTSGTSSPKEEEKKKKAPALPLPALYSSNYYRFLLKHHVTRDPEHALLRAFAVELEPPRRPGGLPGDPAEAQELRELLRAVQRYLTCRPSAKSVAAADTKASLAALVESSQQWAVWRDCTTAGPRSLSLLQLQRVFACFFRMFSPSIASSGPPQRMSPLLVQEVTEDFAEFCASYNTAALQPGRMPVNHFLLYLQHVLRQVERYERASHELDF